VQEEHELAVGGTGGASIEDEVAHRELEPFHSCAR
jgi:hypothetical protein